MKYSFYKEEVSMSIILGVMPEEKYSIIFRFGDSGWTPQKIQTIIDGIEESKTKEKGDEYKWANEDVVLFANKNGILLIDSMAQRGGVYDPDIISLRLTHDEMLTFLKDFKKFIVDNKQ